MIPKLHTRDLPQGYKSSLVDSKRNTQPSVGSSFINNSETVYTAQMSIDRWMGRDNVVNIHTATSLIHQKGWNEAIYNDVGEVEGLMLNELSQRKTYTKYHTIAFTCEF